MAFDALVFAWILPIAFVSVMMAFIARNEASDNNSNPRNNLQAGRAHGRATRISRASTVATSQPQSPTRIVQTSQSRGPSTTQFGSSIDNHNQASDTSRPQQPNIQSMNSNSQPARQQSPSASRARSSSGQAPTGNQPNSLRLSRFPATNFSTDMSYGRHSSHYQARNPTPNFSLDDLNSFCVTTKFQKEACPICLEPLRKELVSAGNCLHLVHATCLKRWLVRDIVSACPVCRVPVADNSSQDTQTRLAHIVMSRAQPDSET